MGSEKRLNTLALIGERTQPHDREASSPNGSRLNEARVRDGFFFTPAHHTAFSQLPCISTMATQSRPPNGRDDVLSALNTAIASLKLAKEGASVTPAKNAFTSAGVLLTAIKVRFLPARLTDH